MSKEILSLSLLKQLTLEIEIINIFHFKIKFKKA